jgi:hypothetical protein
MRALWNSYLFILIPFVMLCFIKGVDGKWDAVLMSTDWAVASFIIFSQSLGLVTKAVVKNKKDTDGDVLTSFIIKVVFLGIFPSVYLYFKMNTSPTEWAAYGQIIMFIYASWRFFVDGRKAQILTP